MNALPVRTVALTSDLAPGALAGQLSSVIRADPAAPFAGAAGPDGFVITRVNEFRSTYMPLLRGRIATRPGGGSQVLLRLRPHRVVTLFMAIWLAFLAAVAALIVAAHAQDPGRSLALLLVPGGLALLSWLVMASVFASDAHWAVESLVAALPALRPAERT